MKAININGIQNICIVDIEEADLAADEVLIRLEYVGFCGSDLNTYLGRNPMVKLPVIPGHEIGAVVEKVGEAVPDMIRPGMTVAPSRSYASSGTLAGRTSPNLPSTTSNAPMWNLKSEPKILAFL